MNAHQAACDAAAELAFIAPEIMTPRLVDLLASELDPRQLRNIGPTEAAIFRTPDGVAFVDVLSQKTSTQNLDRNIKDYDTLKWEQELRAQLAQKQGPQRKLSPEEQGKVRAQLAKEANIRKEVAAVEVKLQRGLGLVSSLARGPPTDAETWIGPAISAVFSIIDGGVGVLLGDRAAFVYLDCAKQVAQRLGSTRQFIGVATLRAQGSSNLPAELEVEPLGSKLIYWLGLFPS